MMGLIEVLQETSQPHRVMITNTEEIHNSQSSAGTNTGFEFFFFPLIFFLYHFFLFSQNFLFLSVLKGGHKPSTAITSCSRFCFF